MQAGASGRHNTAKEQRGQTSQGPRAAAAAPRPGSSSLDRDRMQRMTSLPSTQPRMPHTAMAAMPASRNAQPPTVPAGRPLIPSRGAQQQPSGGSRMPPINESKPSIIAQPSSSSQENVKRRPPPPPSEAGTNADWWRPGSSGSSVDSYPMTAVTDRGGSVASTEFRAWMERISQLESAVNTERSKRREFEEELKKLQTTVRQPSNDSTFQVSRGYLSTSTGQAPPAPAGNGAVYKPAMQAGGARGR